MKILFADDHPLFREGVKPLLAKMADDVDILEAADYPSVFSLAQAEPELDLALLDLFMPGMPGIEGVRKFRAAFPSVPVIMLSATEQAEHAQNAIDAGASGFINKSSPQDVILSALKLVLAGGVYLPPMVLQQAANPGRPTVDQGQLTQRQLQVLAELAQGKSNKLIADALGLTEGTVKIHLAAIFRILHVHNRTEAVLAAQKMGLPSKLPDHGV